ncbi:hypothetical protein JW879_09965 [candidate division WOR-3 bacterium]|nr:hypothetical protein [candidate division WOR-3 bacterium]
MFRKVFEVIIIFTLFISFFGRAEDYLIRSEEELVGREASPLRSELDAKVVSKDGQGFSLSVKIKNIAFVRDSVSIKELYVHGSEERGDLVVALLGAVVGYGGCMIGQNYAKSEDCMHDGSDKLVTGCMMSVVSALLGLGLIKESSYQGYEFTKVLPSFIKTDTVCVDSMFLIKQKLKISIVDSDFEKSYYTDENGNIELWFDEIISEPTDADSILDIIIRYYELVDTVEVKVKERGIR